MTNTNGISVSGSGHSPPGAERRVDGRVRAGPGLRRASSAGPMVEDFERDFAAFCDTQYCVGVGSGTDALRFALIAAGVGKATSSSRSRTRSSRRPRRLRRRAPGRSSSISTSAPTTWTREKLREYLEVQCGWTGDWRD